MPIDLPRPRRGRPPSPPTTPIMLRLPVEVVDRLAAAYTARGLPAPPVQVAIRQALDWWLAEHEISVPPIAPAAPAAHAVPIAPVLPVVQQGTPAHNVPAPAPLVPTPRRRASP